MYPNFTAKIFIDLDRNSVPLFKKFFSYFLMKNLIFAKENFPNFQGKLV